jgi:transposase
MVAALDPLGLPLVTEVVAGNQADAPLYIPAVDWVLQIIEGVGLLFDGDSKMSALAIRAHIHALGQHYLCPLAQTKPGKTGRLDCQQPQKGHRQPDHGKIVENVQ